MAQLQPAPVVVSVMVVSRGAVAVVLTGAAFAGVGAVAPAASPTDAYVVTVNNEGTGGNPGFLYVGGPEKITLLRDRDNAEAQPYELCIKPRPVEKPSCLHGTTGKTINAPAPSVTGLTTYRFTLANGTVVARRAVVRKAGQNDRAPGFDAHQPAIASFSSGQKGVGAIVRLNGGLARLGDERPAFIVAPELHRGQLFSTTQQFYGGLTPGKIGRASRHCYVVEAVRPRPLAQLRTGAHWKIGILDGRRVAEIAAVNLRTAARDGDPTADLQRLGCNS